VHAPTVAPLCLEQYAYVTHSDVDEHDFPGALFVPNTKKIKIN